VSLFRVITSRVERKLALLLSLVSVLALSILGYLAVQTVTLARQQNVAELEWQLTNQSVDRLRKFIDDKIENFRIVVADPNVNAIGYEQQTFILEGHLAGDSSLVELSFIQPTDGFETARVVRGYDKPIHRVLGLDEPAVAAALKGENYFGPVFFSDNEPRIVLASPVTNQQGVVIGLLRGEANLTTVSPLVAQANLGESGYLYVVDQSGRVIASSSVLSNRLSRGTDLKRQPFVSQVLSTGLAPALNTATIYNSNIAREKVFAVGRTIPKFGWAVVVEWPEAEAMAVVSEVVGRLVAGTFILLLALVIVSLWLARKITKPLRQLTTAAAQIGQGKFDVVLPTASQDEVGELARSFGIMTQGLKELERLKDEFVFIAAHELRTPVTAIRGYAEMLGDASKDLPEQAKEFVTRLQQSGGRLAILVNDLLEVARSQAGRLKVQTSPQDIVAIISATLAELKSLADEKKHIIVFSPPPQLPQVMADKDKLQEVLVNLVGNAIKYTPPQGKVEVGLRIEGDSVVTWVKDNGIGITAEDQAKLFQRFFRVESDETRNIQGTGLGLFIVRQIIEHMNGRIWVESTKGQGSTFLFTLLAGDFLEPE